MSTSYRDSLKSNAAKAYDTSQMQTQALVAQRLKEQKDAIAHVMEVDERLLTSKQLNNMAREYLQGGNLTVRDADGQVVRSMKRDEFIQAAQATQQSVNSALKPFTDKVPNIARLIGLGGESADLNNKLPSHNALSKPAERVSEAVQEHEGILSQLMIALKGFIAWIMDWFDGGDRKGLMEHINIVGAKSVAKSAHDKIAADMKADPALRNAIGGAQGLQNITRQIEQGVINHREGREGATLTDAVIEQTLDKTNAIPLLKTPEQWSNQDILAAEGEVKSVMEEPIRQQIDKFFDVKGNDKFWSQLAKDNATGATKVITYFGGGGKTARDKVLTAIGGEEGKSAIAQAISNGALNAVKTMDKNQLKGLMNDPDDHKQALANDIIEHTFKTDQWRAVEERINKSSMTPEEKISLIAKAKDGLANQIQQIVQTNMAKSGALMVPDEVKESIVVAVERFSQVSPVPGNLSIAKLNRIKDNILTLDEFNAYNSDSDQRIDQKELIALRNNMSQEEQEKFQKILDDASNAALVKRDSSNHVTEIDFSSVAGLPKNQQGLQIT